MFLAFTNGRHHNEAVQNRNTGQHDKPNRCRDGEVDPRSEEHTSELQSLMRNSYAVFCLKKKKKNKQHKKTQLFTKQKKKQNDMTMTKNSPQQAQSDKNDIDKIRVILSL